MIGLTLIGALVVLLLTPALSATLAIYNAYWAAKVWAVLVVPVFHWPPLPLAGAVGIALVAAVLRPSPTKTEDESKSVWIRVGTTITMTLLLGPLVYFVATIVGRILL